MADTLTLVSNVVARVQFQGLFAEMFTIRATIDDQDAIAVNRTAVFDMTVTGLLLGDIVLFWSSSLDWDDGGTDLGDPFLHVSANDALTLHVHADLSEFAADALNAAVIRAVVGRPRW